MKAAAGLVAPEAFLLDLQMAIFTLFPPDLSSVGTSLVSCCVFKFPLLIRTSITVD